MVCSHRRNREIDALRAGGNASSLAQVARRFGVSESGLQRHRDRHLGEAQTNARPSIGVADRADFERFIEQAKLDNGEDVLNFSRWVLWRVSRLVDRAEKDGDVKNALAGLATMMRALESFFARTSGLLNDAPQVNIVQNRVVAMLGDLTLDELRSLASMGPRERR